MARAVADFRAVFGDGASDASSSASPPSTASSPVTTPGLCPPNSTAHLVLDEIDALGDGEDSSTGTDDDGGSGDGAGSHKSDDHSDVPSAYDADAELLSTDDDDVPEAAIGGSGPMPVTSFEDYCAYLFLSGQCNVTEASYDIFRRFHNVGRPAHALLRDKTTIRRVVAPAVRAKWGLKIEEAAVPSTRDVGGMVNVTYILPSTHVKRDIAFRGTYDLFFAATGPDADPDLEPEYCDSPMHRNRRHVTCPHLNQEFNVDGKIYTAGGKVNIELDGNRHLHGLSIGTPAYAPADAGLNEASTVRAGDFLLPCLDNGTVIGRVVSPHWLVEDAVKLSWHPVDGDACHVVSMDPVHVDATPIVGVPPPRHTRGVRSVDSAGNITLYVSICPFTDDFQVYEGKSTSAGTVAFNYPQWRYRHKASRHAVRYIGVSPAGVSSDDILRLITPDLREGCTTGWFGKDPDGHAVRIMADVSFFIGDYTQVAKSSRMRGVRADAPCPICSFQKAKEAGSQYAGNGDSSDVSLTRTTSRTLAVISSLTGIGV